MITILETTCEVIVYQEIWIDPAEPSPIRPRQPRDVFLVRQMRQGIFDP